MPLSNKILLDTNFLLIPADKKVDIFNEIERVVPGAQFHVLDKTINELKKIQNEQGGKHREAAKLGMQLIESKNIKIVPSTSDRLVDEILVDMQDEYLIATQDKELKKRLKKCLVLRQEKYVKLIEK